MNKTLTVQATTDLHLLTLSGEVINVTYPGIGTLVAMMASSQSDLLLQLLGFPRGLVRSSLNSTAWSNREADHRQAKYRYPEAHHRQLLLSVSYSSSLL